MLLVALFGTESFILFDLCGTTLPKTVDEPGSQKAVSEVIILNLCYLLLSFTYFLIYFFVAQYW